MYKNYISYLSNNSDSDDGNEKIIKQIRMLSDLKNDGIITEEEFKEYEYWNNKINSLLKI